jgi:nucleoside-diphosphate-sugar epimerase
VTGAPGWLGTRLVRSLAEGLPDDPVLAQPDPDARIRCLVQRGLDRSPLERISTRVEVVAGDVRDRASIEPFFAGARGATLFHLAGIIHPRRIRDLYEINVQGSRHVLEGAVAAGVRRIVAVSSNSPAGCNGRPDHLFDETSPYRPYMHYGRSKMQMEEILHRACEAGRIESVVVRPCWFYGPEQPRRQTRFFSMIRQGKVPVVGSGEARRSMSYLDNTCQGLVLAARTDAARGRTYWIADRRPYSMNEIVATIERLLESEFAIPVARGRMRLPDLASRLAWGADLVLQGIGRYVQEIHVLSEMNKTIACSIARAERELGYRPKVDLEEGMRRSIRWCLDSGIPI